MLPRQCAADTSSVPPSIAVLCRLCQRLSEQRGLLLLEYDAAVDALAATQRSADAYAAQWDDVARLSKRLDKVERLTGLHQQRHGQW
jgi:hypothetical protein